MFSGCDVLLLQLNLFSYLALANFYAISQQLASPPPETSPHISWYSLPIDPVKEYKPVNAKCISESSAEIRFVYYPQMYKEFRKLMFVLKKNPVFFVIQICSRRVIDEQESLNTLYVYTVYLSRSRLPAQMRQLFAETRPGSWGRRRSGSWCGRSRARCRWGSGHFFCFPLAL